MQQLIADLPANVVGVTGSGEITGDDYETVLIPAVEAALADHDKIRLLYVLGDDFTGFSGGAMWEDGKVGVGHLDRWEKIAVVSDKDWVRHSIGVMGYLIPGKVKTFEVDDADDARAWIVE